MPLSAHKGAIRNKDPINPSDVSAGTALVLMVNTFAFLALEFFVFFCLYYYFIYFLGVVHFLFALLKCVSTGCV